MLTAALAAMTMTVAGGCSTGTGSVRGGFDDPDRTQLQFFSPPGAQVTIRAGSPLTQQIAPESPLGDRLERWPEEASVFNLGAGTYEFKYTSADGLPGISVYGELVVKRAKSDEGKMYRRRSFVPIQLPSEYYQKTAINGDEMFPYRGEAFRVAIDDLDLERLKQGDVIEKVFFVADLTEVEERLAETEVEIAVCEREIELAEVRFRNAYMDFHAKSYDSWDRLTQKDKAFIRREADLQEARQELDGLLATRSQLRTLLEADHVLARSGMLVLATEEVVPSHKNVVDSAKELGDVLLVMRIGGRHMQWGAAAGELASNQ